MIVSHAAQRARISESIARTARVRTYSALAASRRRSLIRAELLLTIAAAPRPSAARR